MKWLYGEGPLSDGCRHARQKSSRALRPSSQKTDIKVRIKSDWLRLTPELLMRTKTSATCSSLTVGGTSHGGRRVVSEVEQAVYGRGDTLFLSSGDFAILTPFSQNRR